MRKSLFSGLAALVLVGGMATLASADIPDSSTDEITACRVQGEAGNTRIIDKEDGQSCHSYEDEVSWKASSGTAPHLIEDVRAVYLGAPNTIDVQMDCPAGEYLTYAKAAERTSAANQNDYPGGSPYNSGDNHIYQFVSDSEGRLTGAIWKWNHTINTFHGAIICTP